MATRLGRCCSGGRWLLLVAALACASAPLGALGMYEDQAGTFDWYKPYVGHVVSAHLHKSKPRLYVGTEQGVVGALNLRDGSIAFRTKLDGGPASTALLEAPGVLVSLVGSELQAWEHSDGGLRWSVSLPAAPLSTPDRAPALASGNDGAVAVLTASQLLVRRRSLGTWSWEIFLIDQLPGHRGALGAASGAQRGQCRLMRVDAQVLDAATGEKLSTVALGSEASSSTVGLVHAQGSGFAAYTWTPGCVPCSFLPSDEARAQCQRRVKVAAAARAHRSTSVSFASSEAGSAEGALTSPQPLSRVGVAGPAGVAVLSADLQQLCAAGGCHECAQQAAEAGTAGLAGRLGRQPGACAGAGGDVGDTVRVERLCEGRGEAVGAAERALKGEGRETPGTGRERQHGHGKEGAAAVRLVAMHQPGT